MGRFALALAVLFAVLAPNASAARWYAGDLHVHTCFSHDVFCGPGDDNTGPEEAYTLGESVPQRFAEASLRGLDYVAITDHNDVRAQRDPGFGGSGVLGLPAYENSLRGHAQMLGATRVLDNGDASAAAVAALQQALHRKGGALQANHPGYRADQPFSSCADTAALDWSYGYDVVPDAIEVVNPTAPVATAEAYLECWLQRGARPAVTGGSDNHWVTLA